MHFVCNKCNTKYSIPDSKIAGKILKLRCKKCQNTIVVKDPKAVAALRKSTNSPEKSSSNPEQKQSKGKALLHNAFKASLKENLPDSEMSYSVPESASGSDRSDKTQISMIPDFKSIPVDEEWYLSDDRGQFGPMTLSELIARIKRGEPDADAVVWRDGFDDWMPIHLVPELKPYRKHAPPPRHTGSIEKVSAKPPAVAPVIAPAPVISSTGQFMVNPNSGQLSQVQYGVNQTSNLPVQQHSGMMSGPVLGESPYLVGQRPAQNKAIIYILSGIAGTAVLILILWFVFNMGKTKGKEETGSSTKQQILVSKNDKKATNPVVNPPNKNSAANKKKSDADVIYVIRDKKDNDTNSNGSGNSKSGQRRHTIKKGNRKTGSSNTVSEPTIASSGPTRSKSSLLSVVKNNRDRITRCYAITVRKGQSALVSNKITASANVSYGGKINSISFSGSMPPIMKRCMNRQFKSLSFPKGSGASRFSYTMHFTNN